MARLNAARGRAIGLAIAAALTNYSVAAPQTGAAPTHSVQLIVPEHVGEAVLATRIELPPIRAFELGLAGPAQAQPVVGGGHSMPRSVAELPSLNLIVERELPGLWRFRVPAGMRPGATQVSYQIVAGSGAEGRLSNAELPEEGIPVRVVGSVPFIVESDEASAVLEGGVTLHLDLSEVRHAGRYVGTIQVTMNNF